MIKFIFSIFSFFIGIFIMALWIWCIVDIVKGEFKKENDKIVWLLLVILLPLVGSILYLYMGREQKIDSLEDFV